MNPERVTSRDYAHPARPRAIRMFNRVAPTPLLPKLSASAIIDRARRATGERRFSDESFVEPLEVLVQSINEEARLHALGRVIQQTRLVNLVANRLRIDALYRAHPEIERTSLPPMLIIAGIPRTGTTLLQRLLAAHPDARWLPSWEALNPAPLRGERHDQSHRRRRVARQSTAALRYLAPDFFAIHPIEPDAPEEEILLLDMAFLSQTAEAMLHVPRYAAWAEAADHTPAYGWLRRTLRLLQWLRPRSHWILKTPNHIEHLDALLDQFPEALVIQTHRHLTEVLGSFCSMVAHGRGIFSDHVDPIEVGRHWQRKIAYVLDKAARDRASSDRETRVIDVRYSDLIADPVQTIRSIYEQAGIDALDWTDAQEQARTRNRKDRYGRHVYALEDFGLDANTIADIFADYHERYGTAPAQGANA